MKKLFYTFIFLTVINFTTFSQQIYQSRGVPACPEYFTYIQPDGSQLEMRLFGDGVVHWGETIDGFTILQNEKGFYEYAKLDENNDLISSGIVAQNDDERKTEDLIFLTEMKKSLKFSEKQIQKMVNSHEFFTDKSPKMGGFPSTGEANLIMLLVNFSDTETAYTQSDFDQYMNAPGYDVYGSFKDFYLDASYGLLNVTTTVTDWITLDNTHDYYSTKSRQLVYYAINQIDESIDFSQYDNDGDGYVDGIAVIHQGAGQEASSDVTDIWSHSWNLSGMYSEEQLTFDGVIVDAFTIQPEIYSGGISTIGVMCHEFGHNMGAPDFYDTDYEACDEHLGAGKWDLMSGGSWNMSGRCPANHNIFTKIHYYNWLSPVEISEPSVVTIENSYENPIAYYYSTSTENEYFLLENRQQIGFDFAIPGHGLLIWHVDEEYIDNHYYNNDINACDHQGLYPKSPDGGINSAKTALPGTNNVIDFNDFSNPNSLSWNNEYTNKPISGIYEDENGIITFDFMGGENNPTNFTAISSDENFSIELEWNPNNNSDPVLLVFAQNYDDIGLPIDGTVYSQGEELENGGEVLYYGNDLENYIHENLPQSSVFYYKIFSDLGDKYSSGIYSSAKTNCGVQEVIPYVEEFNSIETLLECWTQNLTQGTIEWVSSVGTGANTSPLPFSGDYYATIIGNYSDETINMLSTQQIVLDENQNYVLKFAHHQPRVFSYQSTLKVLYKNSISDEWSLLQEFAEYTTEWTERQIDLINPSETYFIAFEANTQGISCVCLDEMIVDFKTEIFENSLERNYKIYPNPNSGIFNIEGKNISKIIVYDLTGKQVYEKEKISDFNSIDLSNSEKGVYIIKIEEGNSFSFDKIIIN